MRLEPLFLSSD
ncbi:hypothetical protein CGLO_15713 [Colletotrichum gloeosporioides Cg-14]|uniref:Uncharacterized protein n=1 Tax=Colletotrichum gloeosporioides (strain Cg-14) TaxID=1237896 RepID=T0L1J7_COLGC|nr:hypothetical protein CGLO_15713 [Colletotrichum gloeosporioides Cg-14]